MYARSADHQAQRSASVAVEYQTARLTTSDEIDTRSVLGKMLSSAQHGRTQGDIKRFIPPTKLPKLDLATDVEHVVNLVNQYVVVNVQQCSLSHWYMLYLAYRHFSY